MPPKISIGGHPSPTKFTPKRIINWSVTALLLVFIAIKIFFIASYVIPQNGMYPGLPKGSGLSPPSGHILARRA